MSVIQSNVLDSYGGGSTSFTGNSLRFSSVAGAGLSRTFTNPSPTSVWTYSAWVKRSSVGVAKNPLFCSYSINAGHISFHSSDIIQLRKTSVGVGTTSVYRDTTAFGHVVINSTGSQVKVYWNNVLVYTYAGVLAGFNAAAAHYIGKTEVGSSESGYFDGYMAEIQYVDGQTLDPSNFAETDSVTGQWKPKQYTGAYGVNGFYLDFKDGTSLTTLGYDKSGNNNHWTLTNFTLTADTTYDWTSDSPNNSAIRLRKAVNAKIGRTPTVAGNRKTWTLATNVKRLTAGIIVPIFNGTTTTPGTPDYGTSFVYFTAANKIRVILVNSIGGIACEFVTNASFTSTTNPYHVVVAIDTTQSTIGAGMRVWVNGVAQTNTTTGYTQNFESNINNTTLQQFGYLYAPSIGGGFYSDIYLDSTTFVDGLALPATSFGQTINSTWTPVKYTGAYGTNGFYLDYVDHSSVAALGNDTSGNNNDLNVFNVTLTYSPYYDWMLDYPTNNYSTLNVLKQYTAQTLTQGALYYQTPTNSTILGTHGMSSGKWYWEVLVVSNSGTQAEIGIASDIFSPSGNDFTMTGSGYAYMGSANKRNNSLLVAYGATYTNGDVIGVALDLDAGTLTFYKNNVSQGVAYSGIPANTYFAALGNGNSANPKELVINFGQRPFTYTPPSGHKSLCTQNLPAPDVVNSSEQFQSILATGATIKSTAQGIFTNEIAWMRDTLAAANGQLADSARGINSILQPNTTAIGSAFVTPVNASLGFVWNMGTSAANTTGTISSTTWANPISGVSVVTYTGTGVAGTIGHDIGKAPAFIMVKKTSDVGDWVVYHQTQGKNKHILLNSAAGSVQAGRWNNTAPTASVFSVGTDTTVNAVGATYVAYCFAEIDGFSKFGSYTGNSSSDGPFINLGFRPSFWMHKSFDGSGHWNVYDAAWDTGNVMTNIYYANNTNLGAGNPMDMVSNGVKIRANATGYNISGVEYFYIAFAEAPFKYALAR